MQGTIKQLSMDALVRSDKRIARAKEARYGSLFRTPKRIDDLLDQRKKCLHLDTYTLKRPDVMDDNGDYHGGVRLTICRNVMCQHVVARINV